MSLSPPDIEALRQEGIEALRGGDAKTARDRFDRIVGAGGVPPWMLLARACYMLGDEAGEEAALQHQLENDKRNLPALLAMGELKARQNDDRAASSYFRVAIHTAATMPSPPAQLRPLFDRAHAFLNQASQRYEAHLLERLEDAGLSSDSRSPRLRHALDLMLGKVPLYLQKPAMFYFPGLPQRQFYERGEFDWLPALEARVPAMQAELVTVLADDRDFQPYVTGTPNRPLPNNPLFNDPSWSAYYLWENGVRVEAHAGRCSATMAALDHAPMPIIAERSPMALFSLLKPGTHIAPHHGLLNTRLICHIPLIVPEACALRVGSETRAVREGEAMIFDDSFEHEAWNRSDSVRIVLLFEIWRPEIGADEREELTLLFEAIDLFSGGEGND